MSSRKLQWLAILLMVFGVTLLATAAWFAWQRKPAPQITVEPRLAMETAGFYRPNQSDWWLFFGEPPNPSGNHSALAQPALGTLSVLDPQTPTLPANTPTPLAIAAAGSLRIWQFAAGTAITAPTIDASSQGRWHVETLTDATLLFWLADEVKTTAVDRVAQPLPGSGRVQRAWLQQRLNWPAVGCEALPLLLQNLPDTAQLHLDQETGELRWHLIWPSLPGDLFALLQGTGAPQASQDGNDNWHWREANLASLPRPADCPAAVTGNGFVARLWQHNGQQLAALARPGADKLQGFPLPLPAGVKLKAIQLSNGAGLSSNDEAGNWLKSQTLQPEPGLLLAVQHRRDDNFAGLQLQLRTLPPAGLQLQWRWPLP